MQTTLEVEVLKRKKNGCPKQVFWWKNVGRHDDGYAWKYRVTLKKNAVYEKTESTLCSKCTFTKNCFLLPFFPSSFPCGFDGYGWSIISERKAAKKHHLLILSRTALKSWCWLSILEEWPICRLLAGWLNSEGAINSSFQARQVDNRIYLPLRLWLALREEARQMVTPRFYLGKNWGYNGGLDAHTFPLLSK